MSHLNSVSKKSKAAWLCSFFCVALAAGVHSSAASAKTLIFESTGSQAQDRSESSNSVSPQRPASQPASKVVSTTQLSAAAANANASAALSEMYFMVEQLKREVSELRSLVEEQNYRLEGFQEASKRRYTDLDQRLLTLSKSGVSQTGSAGQVNAVQASTSQANSRVQPPVKSTTGIVPVQSGASVQGIVAVQNTGPVKNKVPPATEEEKKRYAQAYALVKERKFEESVDALHTFIEDYPNGELTGNAYYWLGEVYLVLPQLEQAKQSFLILISTFPDHRKLPDAIFKLAVAYDRLLDPVNSEKYLKKVQGDFPNSTAAKLAKNYKIAR